MNTSCWKLLRIATVHFGGRARALCMEDLLIAIKTEVLLTYALVYYMPRNSLAASSRDDGAMEAQVTRDTDSVPNSVEHPMHLIQVRAAGLAKREKEIGIAVLGQLCRRELSQIDAWL